MNIFLTGFMGCGKSTIGKVLANRTKSDFYDTDFIIEEKVGMSIRDIFLKFGEGRFREIEKDVISKLSCKCHDAVIATGGGTLIDESNVLNMKKSGKIIFLDVPLEKIISRIGNDNTRPLLYTADFSKRCLIYENCSDLIINADADILDVCFRIECATKMRKKFFYLIAGPCCVESEEQINVIAKMVKKLGATHIRAGVFKLRTSPTSFSGLGKLGIDLLKTVKKSTGLPIVTEITKISQIEQLDDVDVIQVGARNAQNFEMLRELGKINKPVLLKRGFSMTLKEFALSSEYVTRGGNYDVILCERGISTFETYTRNTLDVSAVPTLKKLSGLPVIVDPSHAGGKSWLVKPLSLAAVAAGADGLIVEVHNNRMNALCDGAQSLNFEEFKSLSLTVDKIRDNDFLSN